MGNAIFNKITQYHFNRFREEFPDRSPEANKTLDALEALCLKEVIQTPFNASSITMMYDDLWMGDEELQRLKRMVVDGIFYRGTLAPHPKVLDKTFPESGFCHTVSAILVKLDPSLTLWTGYVDGCHRHSWIATAEGVWYEPTMIEREVYYGIPLTADEVDVFVKDNEKAYQLLIEDFPLLESLVGLTLASSPSSIK